MYTAVVTSRTDMSSRIRGRRNRPKAVDLFAGAGLLSYALEAEGFEVSLAIESDQACCGTYRRNVGDHVVCRDVRGRIPDVSCDLLAAGPPCQGFSTLNRGRHDDERQFLSLEVVRWARRLDPSVVLIENVAAYLDSEVFEVLSTKLARLGFVVHARVLDAANFGVAQFRKRSFVVATKGRVFNWPIETSREVTVRHAWNDLCPRPTGVHAHTAPIPSPLALARMKRIRPGGDKRDVMAAAPELCPPSWFRLGCEITDVWGRLHWDRPSNTLRTALQNPSKGRYIHPDQNRVITLREAARLQSIPDNWIFEGYPTHIAKQIGNSVPPRLGRAMAKTVRSLF